MLIYSKINGKSKWHSGNWHSVTGVDELSAAMLIAEIGVDMGRFGGKEKLSSWTGISPGNNESAGKKKADGSVRGTNM